MLPKTVSNFEGQTTEFSYNPQHKVTSIKAPGGIESTFEYYTAGNGKGQISKAHPAAYEAEKFDCYTYDSYGNVKWIERAVSQSAVTESTPLPLSGTFDKFTATPRGDVTETVDRRGVKTTFVYNKRRQRTSSTVWNGTTPHTTSIDFDDAGDAWVVTDASGRKTVTERNALGDVTEVRQGPFASNTLPTQVVLTNAYNTRNLLESSTVRYSIEDPATDYRTTYYDYYDTQVLAAVTDPLGRITTFGYDDDLRRTSVQTPLGAAAQPPYDASTAWNVQGLKDSETDAEGNKAWFTYDKDGRSGTLKNRRSKTFTWNYDDTHRTLTTSTPTGKTTVSILNTRGLPQSIQKPSDAGSPSVTFDVYDVEGRLKKKSDDAGETSFTYYANGLLYTVTETPRVNGALVTASAKTTTRTYDAVNRLESYQDGEGHTVSYTYYPSGELKELTYPGNKTVTYTYDDFGRLYQVKDWRTTNNTTTYTYWENGLLKKIERPNGTVREQSYDAAGQLRYVRESKAGTMFAFQELRYDDDGRIQYSFLHPMPAPITLPFDNMLYDDDNRVSSFNGNAGITFDPDGNMTRGPGLDGVVPSTANFTYDARNRLTSHGGSNYSYNPDGLRVEVTGTGACSYVVDPNAALTRTLMRTKGGVTTYYIYGLGLLYECDASGNNARYYHADQVGSTIALTDGSGNVTDRWSYSPFGTEFRVTGTTDAPFRFNGEFGCITEASGLVYMRARYYHPRVMRFLSIDPIGFLGGFNFYEFAANNPVRLLDPLGLREGSVYHLGRFEVTARSLKLMGFMIGASISAKMPYSFRVGNDAHNTFQEYATRIPGIEAEVTHDGPFNFGGRVDLVDSPFKMLYEIKPAHYAGWLAAHAQLKYYILNSMGVFKGGDGQRIFQGRYSIVLRGALDTYRYFNEGNGVVLYMSEKKYESQEVTVPSQSRVPDIFMIPMAPLTAPAPVFVIP